MRDWLAELAPAQRLRYVYVLCSDLICASPPHDWVLQSLGAPESCPRPLYVLMLCLGRGGLTCWGTGSRHT